MKKLKIFVIFVLLISLITIPVQATKTEKTTIDPSNIRGGGGFKIGIIHLDLNQINSYLQNNGYTNQFDENIVMFGGGGIGGKKDGYRFGGYGMGGSQKVIGNGDEEAILTLGYGGFLLERGIYNKNNMDIALHSLIGGGGMELEIVHNIPEDIEDGIGSPHGSYLKKEFFAIQPGVNYHYQFVDNMGLDLSVGYLLTHDFGGEWNLGDHSVESNMENISGPTFNLQFSFGL